MKKAIMCFVALLVIAAAATGPARAQIYGTNIDLSNGESGTLSSDMTCTYLILYNQGTLTVNQGVTLTLNCEEFNLKTNSAIHLHGTMTGSVGDEPDWNNNSYINVYLSDGAKYTVTGLECMDGAGYLRYYGYDAATDGHGTVSVTNGPTAVTASSIGYSSTTYTFTATPASGYHFVSWTKGAGGEELGTDASIDVTCEQNGQYQVYANFEEDAPAAPTPHTVRFADGNNGWQVQDVTAATSAVAPAVLQNVIAGDSLVVTAPATLPGKVKSVKAVKYVPPVVITWNSTNVFNSDHQHDELDQQSDPLTYEGITISMSGPDDSYFRAYDHVRQTGALVCYGQYGDSFTFEAPSGKKFCKIEIINDEWSISFDQYGDWTQPEDNKVVWRGTAANTVTLGTVFTSASSLNSIVFTLIDAQ